MENLLETAEKALVDLEAVSYNEAATHSQVLIGSYRTVIFFPALLARRKASFRHCDSSIPRSSLSWNRNARKWRKWSTAIQHT